MGDIFKYFEYPFVFMLLPLPFLVSMFFRPENYEKPLKIPFYNDFKHISYKFYAISEPKFRLKQLLLWLSWFFLIMSFARPQYVLKVNDVRVTGRDLLLVVDMSGSMSRKDILTKDNHKIDRFTAVKSVVGDFLSRRVGDRVGLAVFGGTAHLYAPLTFDGQAIATMLGELEIEMVDPNTAIGDGIMVGVKHLAFKDEAKNKVIILLTDGKNNAGNYEPMVAAKMAKTFGIKIYAIGFIGTSNEAVDEAMLIRIADGTGGQYYRATNEMQLTSIYSDIDMLEPSFSNSNAFVRVDVFYYPLFLSLIILVAGASLFAFRK